MAPAATYFYSSLFLLASFTPWITSAPVRGIVGCPGYAASNVQRKKDSIMADLTLGSTACNHFSEGLKDLKFLAEYQTESRLHIIIYDANETVYQIPESVVPRPGRSSNADHSLLDISIEEIPFSFTVTRKSNEEVIFTTKGSNIVFESQYLRVRTSLPEDPVLYGLGEHTDSLKLPTSNYVRTMWARDAGGVPAGENLYGTHPVYYEYRPGSNSAHGVLLMNSNGMDIKINRENEQFLEYNVLGGVIDLYFMAGPGPFDVAREYSEITLKPAMMPYWGLGFHQCRFGYESIDEVTEVVANYSKAGIPLETMWTDIDYMDGYKVFTLGQNFPLDKIRALVDTLHSKDQHYIVMVDPAIAYQDYGAFNRGEEAGIFLKYENGTIYKGRVWPGVTAFPDWFHKNTQDYWNGEFQSFFSPSSGVGIDALWIDMNEPSNFCEWPCDNPEASTVSTDMVIPKSLSPRAEGHGPKVGLPCRNLIDPSYKINNAFGILSNKTARTDLIHSGGWAEYDTHNLYGTMMSKASKTSMLLRQPNKRPMVIARSTFVGAGSYVGHWLGDNISTWDHYRASIRHMLQFVSFFQIPMVGADVCGFLGDTTETLCARWTTLGAFYPFYRNHNVDTGRPQEAYRWERVAEAARKAIDIRYRLLDYIYTAMHQQTVDGTPMLTPMWFHYPTDSATHSIQLQYFYGPSLLISPVTEEGSTSVNIYLPKDQFYDYFSQQPVEGTGAPITYGDVDITSIPVHIRAGTIIPLRVNSANTTTALRKEDFELLVALGKDGKATGALYLDDGESLDQERTSEIEFGFNRTTLTMKGTFGYDAGVGVKSVTILGGEGQRKLELGRGLDREWEVDVGTLQELAL
ncbi:glycoside hydrolase family 31 protein [Zopfia rhizophila CBS 207.26]|uniref:Glycoside hydrolase family 31 protein n=1 Tax=Zopfia rhizophila CBS 207.26 TaxID=1314779 RepID=A0A6A6DSF4_9PEZI|nr:glycoside hydrolase family 31 protein [Zopfia rhizophila CBS 207.26]